MDVILFGGAPPSAAIMITATSRQSRTSTSFLSACRCNHAPLMPPSYMRAILYNKII